MGKFVVNGIAVLQQRIRRNPSMLEKKILVDELEKRSNSDVKNFFKNIDHSNKFVFDFDGVITSKVEDDIFHLKVFSGEASILKVLAERLLINSKIFDTKYIRHLVLQEILLARDILPERGPLFSACQILEREQVPYFILTARSGVAAVKRTLRFLDKNALHPQEIFFVGRVPKGRQLAYVEDLLAESSVTFFDDSASHYKNALNMAGNRDLKSRQILYNPTRSNVQALKLYADCITWAVENLLYPRKDKIIVSRAERLKARILSND